MIQEETKPLVVAVNKVDLIKINRDLSEEIDYVVRAKLPQATKMQVVYISALDKKNINNKCVEFQYKLYLKIIKKIMKVIYKIKV